MAASGEQRKTAPMMVCAGLGAGAVGFFLAGPFFRIKNMLQADAGILGPDRVLVTGARAGQRPIFDNMVDATIRTIQKEGVWKLYSGTGVLVLRGSVLSAGQQLGYDGCKTYCKQVGLLHDGPTLHFVASVCAAFLAATMAAPADVVLTRYQTAPQMGIHYRSVWHCASTMLSQEGSTVFLRGWLPFFARLVPLFCTYLPAMEQARRLLGIGYMS